MTGLPIVRDQAGQLFLAAGQLLTCCVQVCAHDLYFTGYSAECFIALMAFQGYGLMSMRNNVDRTKKT